MAGLDHITVRGLGSIASIEEFRPGPVSVLIGPNGSGKSHFLGAFSLLNAIGEGRLREYVARAGGAGRVLHFGPGATGQIDLSVSFAGGRYGYDVTLHPAGADELIPRDEAIRGRDSASGGTAHEGMGREARVSRMTVGHAGRVRRHLRSWRVHQFHGTGDGSPIRGTADIGDSRHLRSDGSNMAAFLHLLRERHPDSYLAITRAIRQIAPFFEGFDLRPRRPDLGRVGLVWRHSGSDAHLDASSLSDGTLRFMALATLFLQPAEYRPSVILVDEPELGMHPYAITLVAALIRQAATESQVIVSTQSSLLLDHFEPEEVVVTERCDGATRLTRLDSSRLRTWLERYSLGELWEKNELGGRPMPEVRGIAG